MKTIRLNDKMWFGKYKDHRMMDILNRDRSYLDRLCDSGLIKYDDKIIDYIKNYRGEKKSSGYGYGTFEFRETLRSVNTVWDDVAEPIEPPEEAMPEPVVERGSNPYASAREEFLHNYESRITGDINFIDAVSFVSNALHQNVRTLSEEEPTQEEL